MSDPVLVKVASGRARQKLAALLGYLPQGYYSFNKKGEWRDVPAARLGEVLKIKGITRAQAKRADLLGYWS